MKGYTLIEILVALALFAFIASASFYAFEQTRTLEARVSHAGELYQTARVALRTIEDDVRGAWASGQVFDTGLTGSGITTSSTPTDRLELVSANNRPYDEAKKEIDLTRTVYSIVSDKGLVREKYKQLTAATVVVNAADVQEVLTPMAVGLKFRFLDGTAWMDSWDSSTMKKMPKAIEVTVYLKDGDVVTPFSEAIWLPVASGYQEEKK